MATLGERIHTIRKTLGLSQRAFGKPIGLPQSKISQLENGKAGLAWEWAESILLQYNINSEYLLYETLPVLNAGPKEARGMSAGEIHEAYVRLGEADVAEAREIAYRALGALLACLERGRPATG